MAIQFACPTCGKSLKAPDASAGQMAKCPYCQTHVQVPEPAPEAVHEAESVPRGDAAGPPPMPGVPDASEQTGDLQPCPACGEMIKPQAVKCRFCGEVLDPVLRRRERSTQAGDIELGALEILFCIFCAPIAYIVSLVWILQGNPKGLKLYAMSQLVWVAAGIIIYCIIFALGMAGALGPGRFR